jgi:hypothetical protein
MPTPTLGHPRVSIFGLLMLASLSGAAAGCDSDEGAESGLDASVLPGDDASGPLLDAGGSNIDAGFVSPLDAGMGQTHEEAYDGGFKRSFYWADWTSFTPGAEGNAVGYFDLPSGRVEVFYRGELREAQVAPSTARNLWVPAETYLSTAVEQSPPLPDALLINGKLSGVYELVFSKPVKDPIVAFASLGAAQAVASYRFEHPFLLLSQGQGFFAGDGWLEKMPDNVIRGREANGVIGFEGTFTSLRFTSPEVEPYHGLTIAVAEDRPLTAADAGTR